MCLLDDQDPGFALRMGHVFLPLVQAEKIPRLQLDKINLAAARANVHLHYAVQDDEDLAACISVPVVRRADPAQQHDSVVKASEIAGITIENDAIFKDTWGPLTYGKPLSVDQAVAAAARTHELQQALLQRTERAAAEGARIVVWSEGNALVFRSDEPSFLEQGRRLARQNGIYLFMSLATMSPGDRLVENKVVAIDAEGRIRDVYLKSHPTPGEMSRPGDGRIGWMDTPYGRIAWAICYDFDYPELIRQAGRVGADILIDPSWENAGMTPLHTQMATFRAIENGAALFRPVNGGLGMAVDAYGRVLGTLDHFTTGTPDKVLVADLRTKGVATLYPAVGDAFGWLCGGGLALLALVAVRVRWSEGCRRA